VLTTYDNNTANTTAPAIPNTGTNGGDSDNTVNIRSSNNHATNNKSTTNHTTRHASVNVNDTHRCNTDNNNKKRERQQPRHHTAAPTVTAIPTISTPEAGNN